MIKELLPWHVSNLEEFSFKVGPSLSLFYLQLFVLIIPIENGGFKSYKTAVLDQNWGWTFIPIKEGPPCKPSFSRLDTCQGQKSFTLVNQSSFGNQHFWTCVASTWVRNIFGVLNHMDLKFKPLLIKFQNQGNCLSFLSCFTTSYMISFNEATWLSTAHASNVFRRRTKFCSRQTMEGT